MNPAHNAEQSGAESLTSGQIHLWCVSLDDALEPQLLRRYEALMSADERDRAGRFHFERDRLRYIVTRALVRTGLSRYAPWAPAQWQFGTDAHGRPFVVNLPAPSVPTFNISHTRDWIILGVRARHGLGVDVEHARARDSMCDLADMFFSPEEAAALRQLPPAARETRFYEYWTLKEAYIKARGLGLAIPLDVFSFRLSTPGTIEFHIEPHYPDSAQRWRFCQFSLDAQHLAALCAEHADAAALEVVFRRVVPLRDEAIFKPPVLRKSLGF